MNKTLSITASLLMLANTAQAEEPGQWVEWIADAGVAFAQLQNVNLSAFDNDERHDQQLTFNGYLGRYYQLNSLTRFQVIGLFGAQQYALFEQMNNRSWGANLGIRHKFGVGFNVPYVQFSTEYRTTSFNAEPWDNRIMNAKLSVGKHLNDRLSLAGTVEWDKMRGDAGPTVVPGLSSAPFDQHFWRASISFDYLLTQDWLLSGRYTRREGDFHSACTVANVAKVLDTMKVKAITKDSIFNGCVYQLDGNANIYAISLSYAVSEHTAMNLDAQLYQGHADVLDYRASTVQLSFNYRY